MKGELVAIVAIAVVGFMGNLISIVTLVKHPHVMGESQQFILNQCVVDAAAAISLLMSHVFIVDTLGVTVNYQNNWIYDLICRVWFTDGFYWGLMTVSTYNLVFLTLERYIKIIYPFWYRKHFGDRMAKFFLIFPWVFGLVFKIGSSWDAAIIVGNQCMMDPVNGMIVAYTISAVAFFLPFAILCFAYCRIVLRIYNRGKNMDKYSDSNPGQANVKTVSESKVDEPQQVTTQPPETATPVGMVSDMSGNHKAEKTRKKVQMSRTRDRAMKSTEKKVVFILILVVGGFFLCYILGNMVLVLGSTGLVRFNSIAFAVAHISAFANCSINPIIYVLMHNKMREALLATCTTCRR